MDEHTLRGANDIASERIADHDSIERQTQCAAANESLGTNETGPKDSASV